MLRIYGDNIICAPYKKVIDGILIERQYFIIKMSDVPKPILNEIQVNGTIHIQGTMSLK